jgi:hypothetical protein
MENAECRNTTMPPPGNLRRSILNSPFSILKGLPDVKGAFTWFFPADQGLKNRCSVLY